MTAPSRMGTRVQDLLVLHTHTHTHDPSRGPSKLRPEPASQQTNRPVHGYNIRTRLDTLDRPDSWRRLARSRLIDVVCTVASLQLVRGDAATDWRTGGAVCGRVSSVSMSVFLHGVAHPTHVLALSTRTTRTGGYILRGCIVFAPSLRATRTGGYGEIPPP